MTSSYLKHFHSTIIEPQQQQQQRMVTIRMDRIVNSPIEIIQRMPVLIDCQIMKMNMPTTNKNSSIPMGMRTTIATAILISTAMDRIWKNVIMDIAMVHRTWSPRHWREICLRPRLSIRPYDRVRILRLYWWWWKAVNRRQQRINRSPHREMEYQPMNIAQWLSRHRFVRIHPVRPVPLHHYLSMNSSSNNNNSSSSSNSWELVAIILSLLRSMVHVSWLNPQNNWIDPLPTIVWSNTAPHRPRQRLR